MNNNFPVNVPIIGRARICVEMLLDQKIKDKIIVDVGSSFGWLEKEVIKLNPKRLIGIELDKSAVDFAKIQVKKAEFLVGSALDIPVSKNFADIVILFDVIEHVPRGTEEQVLSEINRILKKGGILLFSTPNQHILSNFLDIAWYFGHRHYTPEKIKGMLGKKGFEVKSIESRGSIFSSIYLIWFYIAKRIFNNSMPRNKFLERLDDEGYKKGDLTDIFLVAKKVMP